MVADRESDVVRLETKMNQLQLTRDREAQKSADLAQTVEAMSQQRDAHQAAAAEAASRLGDDVRNLRLALDETSRRERQVLRRTF